MNGDRGAQIEYAIKALMKQNQESKQIQDQILNECRTPKEQLKRISEQTYSD